MNNIICSNVIYKCNSTISSGIYNQTKFFIKNEYVEKSTNRSYISYISESSVIKINITNIDKEEYSLIIIEKAFITDKIIISNCNILRFKGQCEDFDWYRNTIKRNDEFKSITYGFNLINYHSDGVFHGTVEGLTRIVPYIDFLMNNRNIFIFISYPRYKQNTVEKLLLLLGFSRNRIKYGNHFVKKLYIPLPFYCLESSTPLIRKFNKLLRENIKNKCSTFKNNFILLLQRSKNRIIKNINKLKRALNNYFNYTVIVYDDRNINLNEIYCWFAHARIIVGFHGSGLTNIYFSSSKAIVIEFSPNCTNYPRFAFAKLATQIGIKYYIIITNYSYIFTKNIYINISSFLESIKRINY